MTPKRLLRDLVGITLRSQPDLTTGHDEEENPDQSGNRESPR
mgnify:CR=1 FL=1